MKNLSKKIYSKFLRIVPIVSGIMLLLAANSTACWYKGQDELPSGARKYRKF